MIMVNDFTCMSFYKSIPLWELTFRVQLITFMGIKFESLCYTLSKSGDF
jgi:hypothetical protein